MNPSQQDFSLLLSQLSEIGIALSAEKNHGRLLEMILTRAKAMTGADGGTLYLRGDGNTLNFEIMHTESLGVHQGGTSGRPIDLPPLALYDADGQPNRHAVAAWAALSGEPINIEDAYTSDDFDFSGTRQFDEMTGYRSKAFLTVPMTNHEAENIGVLQLINPIDPASGEIRAFSPLDQKLVEALAAQAAVTLTNRSLIAAQRQLFDSLVQLIANAIDEKSPYTAGHCRRVPVLTTLLAEAASRIQYGPLKEFSLNDDDRYELEVAAWLHDCGKITTPEYVVDKATKLETIFDRVNMVDTRFEVLRRDAEIAALRSQLEAAGVDPDEALSSERVYRARVNELKAAREFVRHVNIGGESMSEEDQARVRALATEYWLDMDGKKQPLLNEDETMNLQISRGTLTPAEREVINNHIVVTIKMLESLPYPKHLKKVPEYAGGHHEKMDGTGYPRQLTREQMSVPARVMVIADIFEALTAADRPYKKAMPLSQALTILGRMKENHHVDPDLFDIFMWEKVYLQYAEQHLQAEQVDAFDLDAIPGYSPPQ
ncbi:MAG: HD domain-containing phosphohydrolase [Gammaproteobacteria bacterium]